MATPADGFSYYSRRATLAGVLGTTFLYWLDDQSDGSPTLGLPRPAHRGRDADRPTRSSLTRMDGMAARRTQRQP